jgi:hypothetical protein
MLERSLFLQHKLLFERYEVEFKVVHEPNGTTLPQPTRLVLLQCQPVGTAA